MAVDWGRSMLMHSLAVALPWQRFLRHSRSVLLSAANQCRRCLCDRDISCLRASSLIGLAFVDSAFRKMVLKLKGYGESRNQECPSRRTTQGQFKLMRWSTRLSCMAGAHHKATDDLALRSKPGRDTATSLTRNIKSLSTPISILCRNML
jgi:hypothetical protein